MAHETIDALSAAPWRGNAIKGGNVANAADAAKKYGLDWKVELVPLVTGDDARTPVTHNAVRRMDTGAVIGVTGPGWKPLQNSEVFEIVEPWVASGEAVYDCAQSLYGGKRVFVSVRFTSIDSAEIVKGDEVRPYGFLGHAHDGSLAIRFGPSGVRVVCCNMFRAVMGSEPFIRVQHRKNAKKMLEQARELVDVQRGAWAAKVEQFRALAGVQIDAKTLTNVVRAFAKSAGMTAAAKAAEPPALVSLDSVLDMVEMPETAIVPAKPSAMDELIERITENMECGRGSDVAGVRGTLWGLYNAMTEEVQHERGYKNPDNRTNAILFGEAARASDAALRVCMEAMRRAA